MANLGDLSGGTTKITSGIALNTLVNETLEFSAAISPVGAMTQSGRKRIRKKNSTAAYAIT